MIFNERNANRQNAITCDTVNTIKQTLKEIGEVSKTISNEQIIWDFFINNSNASVRT